MNLVKKPIIIDLDGSDEEENKKDEEIFEVIPVKKIKLNEEKLDEKTEKKIDKSY